MFNSIECKIDNQAVNLLSLDLKTSMDSYCWQCDVQISDQDFKKFSLNKRNVGEEALLDIYLNGYHWRFMLEQDFSDNRKHAAHGGSSFNVMGRSVSAIIGKDYAKTLQGIISSDYYARQIADEQLKLLPVKIKNWLLPDWFIPANTYAISGKTPLAVLSDIATAAGGFIVSHRQEALLDLKPRWKNPAWNLKTPDIIIPANLVYSISGQKVFSQRMNGVHLIPSNGGTGGNIYRSGTDGLPRMPSLNHPLYCDVAVFQAAGISALSDSGAHKIETVELPLNIKNGSPLAELGEIWQIEELNDYWLGIIRQVNINAKIAKNGALDVRQN